MLWPLRRKKEVLEWQVYFAEKKNRVIIDIDTQFDLVFNCKGPSNELVANIRRLMAWARQERIPVISTQLTCRPGNGSTKCIAGTKGQQKLSYTLLKSRREYPTETSNDLPPELLKKYQQVVFEKVHEDPFEIPRADRLLSGLEADEIIIFGIGLETALASTILGLIHRGKEVIVVKDAISKPKSNEETHTLRKIEAKGARLVKTEQLTGPSHLRGIPGIITRNAQVTASSKKSDPFD